MPSFMPALQALANFGTGYFQGQDSAAEARRKQLELDEKMQQQARQRTLAERERLESDEMMRSFQATIGSPGGSQGQPQDGHPPQPHEMPIDLIQAKAQPEFGSADWFLARGRYAASIGDMQGATAAVSNATAVREADIRRRNLQASAQAGELKRQAESRAYIASVLGDPSINAAADPEGEFNNRLQRVLSNPMITPDERANLQGLQYAPGVVSLMARSGMTGAQQARDALDQLRFSAQEQDRQARLNISRERLELDRRRAAAEAAERARKSKEGKGTVQGAPNNNEYSAALPVVQSIMGGSFNADDPGSVQAVNTVASRAKQITSQPGNNMTFAQAAALAAQQMKDSGEFVPETQSRWFGILPDEEVGQKFSPQPGTQSSPIPLQGLGRADLEDGKWYTDGRTVEQYHAQ